MPCISPEARASDLCVAAGLGGLGRWSAPLKCPSLTHCLAGGPWPTRFVPQSLAGTWRRVALPGADVSLNPCNVCFPGCRVQWDGSVLKPQHGRLVLTIYFGEVSLLLASVSLQLGGHGISSILGRGVRDFGSELSSQPGKVCFVG